MQVFMFFKKILNARLRQDGNKVLEEPYRRRWLLAKREVDVPLRDLVGCWDLVLPSGDC